MISVIGAGPAGSHAAYLLAKEGYKVNLYEDHSVVGIPIQCTGITTGALLEVINLDKSLIMNEITTYRIISPDNNELYFKLRKKDIVFDRSKFDQHITEEAVNAGAKLHLKSKFNGLENNGKLKVKINNEVNEADYLIGADGPSSLVAKSAGIYGKRRFIVGAQTRIKRKFDPEIVDIYLGLGGFGWLVPESETIARTGVVAYTNVNQVFNELLSKLKKQGNYEIIDYPSGIIPEYDPNVKSQLNNIYLLGDAATHVKATTYGGIIYGLMGAQELTKSIVNNQNYEGLWRKRFGKDLWLGLAIRKAMDRFSDKEYNELLRLISQEKIKNIVETNDRDFPTKFLFKLLMKEPRLMKYGLKAIPSLLL